MQHDFSNASTDALLTKFVAVRTNSKPRLSKMTRQTITHELLRREITEQRELIQMAIENLQGALDEAEAATNMDAPTWEDIARLELHVALIKQAELI